MASMAAEVGAGAEPIVTWLAESLVGCTGIGWAESAWRSTTGDP